MDDVFILEIGHNFSLYFYNMPKKYFESTNVINVTTS